MHDLALFVAAALFAVMGVAALLVPDRVTGQFGIPRFSVAGRNEIRGVYGGFGLAMAAMLVVATVIPDLRVGVGLAIAAALAGMALGRVVSAIVDRGLPARPLMYLVIEIVAVSLILFGAFPN
jgi:membrane associated rhomboid family serine protease